MNEYRFKCPKCGNETSYSIETRFIPPISGEELAFIDEPDRPIAKTEFYNEDRIYPEVITCGKCKSHFVEKKYTR